MGYRVENEGGVTRFAQRANCEPGYTEVTAGRRDEGDEQSHQVSGLRSSTTTRPHQDYGRAPRLIRLFPNQTNFICFIPWLNRYASYPMHTSSSIYFGNYILAMSFFDVCELA